MPAGTNTFFQKLTKINFTVLNKSANRKIHIFNYPIMPGQTRDLFYIPGVSEDDIRNSLVKGELAAFIRNGTVSIVSSSIDLSQYDPSQAAFITSAGDTITPSSSPNYAAQTTWYIDGQNVTGLASDLNDGLTASTPLATDQQRAARVGASVVNVTMTVTLLSSLQSTDFITEPFVGLNGGFVVIGSPGATVLHTGTLTAAAAHSGNNPATLTDTAVNWSTAGVGGSSLIGYRFRVTSGTRTNAVSWLMHDNGSGVAVCTDPEIKATSLSEFKLNSVNLQAGDPYVIESLPVVPSIISPYPVQVGTNSSSIYTRILYEGIKIGSSVSPATSNSYLDTSNAGLESRLFVACQMGLATTYAYFLACCWYPPAGYSIEFNPGLEVVLLGCGFIGSSTAVVSIAAGAVVTMDQNTLVYGIPLIINGGWLGIATYALGGGFVEVGAGICNSNGDGLRIYPGGSLQVYPVGASLWGSGNAGYGIRVYSGGLGTYGTKPTLTGTTNDTIIGGTATAYASIPFVNTANQAMLVLLA